MIHWMLWATLVTALLGLAGLVCERLLRMHDRQTRWAWVGVLTTAAGLQAWSWLRPFPGVAPAPPVEKGFSGIPLFLLEAPQSATSTIATLLAGGDTVASAMWVVSTVVLMIAITAGLWRLRREMGRWTVAKVEGEEVLLSERFGPALVGFLFPRIVVPRWALALDPEQLRLTFLHESEHRSARDTLLLLGGSVALALTPWNPALWWSVSRLRQAVELDCDERVLRSGVSRSIYGALLIDLSAHPFTSPLPVAALAKPASLLERRLRMMTNHVHSKGPFRTAGLVTVAALLGLVACETPPPSGIDSRESVAVDAAEAAPERGVVALSSMGSADMPLVVVDEVPLEGAAARHLDDLDPDYIEKIEVLKGAAAIAAYGERGANGVILITTRETPVDVDEDEDALFGESEQTPLTQLEKILGERRGFRASEREPEDRDIYVDGERFEGTIADLDVNPDDIDRIEVFKGNDEAKPRIEIFLKPR